MTRSPAVAWTAVGAWCALLFWLSTRPAHELPTFDLFQFDKLAHLGAWTVLGALLRHALALSLDRPARTLTWLAAGLAIGYGATDELHQGLGMAGRIADPLDLLADAAGAVLGATLHARVTARSSS